MFNMLIKYYCFSGLVPCCNAKSDFWMTSLLYPLSSSSLIITKLKIIPYPWLKKNTIFLLHCFLQRDDVGKCQDELSRLNQTILILCLTQHVVSQFRHLTWKYVQAVSTIKSPVTTENYWVRRRGNISLCTNTSVFFFLFKIFVILSPPSIFVILKDILRLQRDILGDNDGSLGPNLPLSPGQPPPLSQLKVTIDSIVVPPRVEILI